MYFRSARAVSVLCRKDLAIYILENAGRCAKMHSLVKQKCKLTPVCRLSGLCHLSDCPPKCWQCNYPQKSDLFCSKCKALQKMPEELNYFDIIGVKLDFDISPEEVQKKYRQLQVLLHPDKFGQKSEKEQKISENLSSLVNKAYSTLMHPLDRGLYMLKLHNVTIPEESSRLEPDFLMEIMEKNEQIEEAAENKDRALELLKQNKETLASLTKQISQAFHNEDINEAKRLLIRMKYYISIENRLKQLKQNLGIVE